MGDVAAAFVFECHVIERFVFGFQPGYSLGFFRADLRRFQRRNIGFRIGIETAFDFFYCPADRHRSGAFGRRN